MSGFGTRPTAAPIPVDANRQALAQALLGIPARVGQAFTGMAQSGLQANEAFLQGRGTDGEDVLARPFLPGADTGGRLGALASFLNSNMALGGPAGSLGAGPTMRGRAAIGGEDAINGYFYKGGQFLPQTEAPPGSWRVKANGKASNIPNGQELIAPGEFAARPTPFSRSIHQVMGAGSLVDIGADGVARLNPRVDWNYMGTTPDAKSPVRFKNLAQSSEQFSVNDLVDMWNKGVRWIDTEPLPGVEIVAKGNPLAAALSGKKPQE